MVEEKMNIHIYLIPIYLLLTFLVIVFVQWLITKKPLFPPLYVNALPDVNKEHIAKLTQVGNAFFRFMNQNKLPYVVIAGSLLGMVRHSGNIIPWDDDIDVAIPEERRAEIINKLKDEFGEQIQEYKNGLYKYIIDDTFWVDIFVMQKVSNKYVYVNPQHTTAWPNEWLNADVFDANGQMLGPFCATNVWFPKEFEAYLDRSYPKWSTKACIGQLHTGGLKEQCLNIISSVFFNICKKL